MKKLVNALLVLFLVGGVVAGVLFFATLGKEKDADKAPSVTAEKKKQKPQVVYMSTDPVIANIEKRLESTSGLALTIRCPQRVNDDKGTKFRCSIRREGQSERIAVARVEIVGDGGQFKWTSAPVGSTTSSP